MENQEAQIRSRITRNDGFKCTLETISIENHNPGGSPRWPRTFRFEKKNCSPSIPTPLSFFYPSLVPFIFSPHFIFSPFDCHRFIQLSFTDKRARSHRLYRRAAIECSLPFLFNAYSINWRGITSNDFIGRWIKQIMPARKVETT